LDKQTKTVDAASVSRSQNTGQYKMQLLFSDHTMNSWRQRNKSDSLWSLFNNKASPDSGLKGCNFINIPFQTYT
jgi:hypothetical protein